jgi:uncharacterized OB-fold protein
MRKMSQRDVRENAWICVRNTGLRRAAGLVVADIAFPAAEPEQVHIGMKVKAVFNTKNPTNTILDLARVPA